MDDYIYIYIYIYKGKNYLDFIVHAYQETSIHLYSYLGA